MSHFKKDEKKKKRENLKLDLEYNSQKQKISVQKMEKKYSKNIRLGQSRSRYKNSLFGILGRSF